jgi:site-specific DNA-methyltransferase (adenine-specific)
MLDRLNYKQRCAPSSLELKHRIRRPLSRFNDVIGSSRPASSGFEQLDANKLTSILDRHGRSLQNLSRTFTSRVLLGKLTLFRRYDRATAQGRLYHGDALDLLRSLKDDSATVVFLDPPFNLGKRYDSRKRRQDRQPEDVYRAWMERILIEAIRVLAPGGALYLYHIPLWAMRLGSLVDQELDLRHWIAISMKNGFVRGKRLYPAHYCLLYFTKGQPAAFRRPKVSPAVCRHCKRTIKDYGGYRRIIERKGINLSDFWEDVSPVRHATTKLRKQNQLPLTITDRVFHISGVVDGRRRSLCRERQCSRIGLYAWHALRGM